MTDDDIKLKLLANEPIHIDGIGDFQLPSIREIIKMGESKYQESMSWLLFSKDQLQSPAEDVEEYTEMEVFATLMIYDVSFRKNVFDAFKTFFSSEPQLLENGVIYFNELSEESILTGEKWEYIKKLIRIGNFIGEKKEDFKAGNEQAKKLIEKIMKKKQLEKKQEQINLHSIISAVGWKTNSFFDILSLTFYQLYDGYYRNMMLDDYKHTITGVYTGIYTGNIDGTKVKMPEITWANIIKFN